MRNKHLFVLPLVFAIVCVMIIPFASAKTVAVTATNTSRDIIRSDDSTLFVLSVEVVHYTTKADGSSIFMIHTVTDLTIKYDGGYTYSERIVYNNVQNTAAGNGPVYNGAYTEHFVSGGYRLLSHSEYAYSNGEIRVNQYWTKEN